MKIKHAPSGRNAYWFENAGEHEMLHVGCFAETAEKSVEVYADLLGRLYLDSPSLWIEFQSKTRWWLNERRRDRKLSWKAPAYQDESYLAFEMTGKEEILDSLKRFWLLKGLRCYFWKRDGACVQPEDILPRLARIDFKELAQYIPSAVRFAAERDVCSSYLRVMFHRNDAKFVEHCLGNSAASASLKFVLEAALFRT